MEKNSTTRHVAIVEKCVMTEMAWRYIFSREDNSQYHIHLFKNVSMLRAAEASFPGQPLSFHFREVVLHEPRVCFFFMKWRGSDRKSKRLFWLIMKVKCT
jgi:hypothetical protein